MVITVDPHHRRAHAAGEAFLFLDEMDPAVRRALAGADAQLRRVGPVQRGAAHQTVEIPLAVGGVTALQVAGPDRQLTDAVANGRGFQAVSVAWLSRLSPVGILVVSFLFSVMQKGASMMQTEYRIPSSMSDILQGIILFFVLQTQIIGGLAQGAAEQPARTRPLARK